MWKVYRKEANAYDTALLDGWSSTLDILLIFVRPHISYRFASQAKLGRYHEDLISPRHRRLERPRRERLD